MEVLAVLVRVDSMRNIITILLFFFAFPALAAQEYYIQIAHDDDFFLINNEKFSAKTYCFNFNEGDRVIFIEGEPNGICASATFYDFNNRESCEVWCE